MDGFRKRSRTSRKHPFSAILIRYMKTHIRPLTKLLLLAFLCSGMVFQTAVTLAADPEPECKNPLIDDCGKHSTIYLMQPLDDSTKELTVTATPLDVFFTYFNMSWPWLLGIASGIAVLQAVWGGVLIMTSWDTDGGKEKIEWALGGMVMIALAGFILRFLNPIFFK